MKDKSLTDRTGDSDLITRRYYDSFVIKTRQIDANVPSTTINFLGKTLATPIMSAAMSNLSTICENGSVEMANGIKAANSVMWQGVGSEEELESIVKTGVNTVKIIKPFADMELVFRQMEHAKRYGVMAVGMDIDHSFSNTGEFGDWKGYPMKPKTVAELKEIVKRAEVPFIVKGVLSVEDAYKSVEAGAKGIVLSHHHGKMEFSIPPLMILPEVVRAVGNDIAIIIDSGISNGFDVFKALAFGANAVCVGRALIPALKTDRSKGIQEQINLMTQELAGIMARTGSVDIEHISSDSLVQI